MVIKRTFNNKEYSIKLSPEEMTQAYFEQQNIYDIEDVVSYAEVFSNEDLIDLCGGTYSEILSLKEEIADEMRRNIDKYGMEWSYAREEAVRDVIIRNKTATPA